MRAWFLLVLFAGCSDESAHAPNEYITWTERTADVPQPIMPQPMPVNGPFYTPDLEGFPVPILRQDAPNAHYARLDAVSCGLELTRRGVAFAPATPMSDVMAPIRLRGPLHGVSITGPAASLPASIFDCRLALALDDYAALVAKSDVVEMIYSNAYRSRANAGCTAKYAGLQHCGALAVDVHAYKKRDGTMLSVEKDFHGRIGQSTCAGVAHPNPATPAAEQLWGFVCDAAARAIFNVILTPNYNAEHFNHMHLEVTPGAEWMLIK